MRIETSLALATIAEPEAKMEDTYRVEEIEPLYNEPARYIPLHPCSDDQDVYLIPSEAIIFPIKAAVKVLCSISARCI